MSEAPPTSGFRRRGPVKEARAPQEDPQSGPDHGSASASFEDQQAFGSSSVSSGGTSEAGELLFSGSVQRTLSSFGNRAVGAPEFMAALCKLHSNYAGRIAGQIEGAIRALPETRPMDAEQWPEELLGVISPEWTDLIETRHVMLGLALLDRNVFDLCWQAGFFAPLFAEIKAPELATKRDIPFHPPPA